MKKLVNRRNNKQLASDVRVATNLFARMKGLIGQSDLAPGHALWIHRCNWVHTWFMRFAIDVVFVDDTLVVHGVARGVKPWRLPAPRFKAKSVFEMRAGTLDDGLVEIGDQLHVGD